MPFIAGQVLTAAQLNALDINSLTVDTSVLVVDATNNRVGIGTASPAEPLHIADGTDADIRLDDTGGAFGGSTNAAVQFYAGGTYSGTVGFATASGEMILENDAGALYVTCGSTGPIYFRTSDTTRMQVNNSEPYVSGAAFNAGTWTPTITQGSGTPSFTNTRSRYWRMGTLCVATFDITFTAGNPAWAGDQIEVTLPFTAANANGIGGALMFSDLDTTAGNQIGVAEGISTSAARFRREGPANSYVDSEIETSDLANGFLIFETT